MDFGRNNKEVQVNESGQFKYCPICDELQPRGHICYKDKKIDRLKGLRQASEDYIKNHRKEVIVTKG
jgi:hypothetical protein